MKNIEESSDMFSTNQPLIFCHSARKGGSDAFWIKDARASRQESGKLSWHQLLDFCFFGDNVDICTLSILKLGIARTLA